MGLQRILASFLSHLNKRLQCKFAKPPCGQPFLGQTFISIETKSNQNGQKTTTKIQETKNLAGCLRPGFLPEIIWISCLRSVSERVMTRMMVARWPMAIL